MNFKPTRVILVSAAASLIGIAMVLNSVFLLLGGQTGHALMRAGLGLYCCVWAFVPYDKFLQVARMQVRLRSSAERYAYASLFPAPLLVPMWLAIFLMVGGFIYNVVDAFS